MKSEYEQQAEAFLKATNTEFKCEFLKHGKHFVDDKETRDIYRITLTRGKRSYTFNFGQSIACSGFKVYVTNTGKQMNNLSALSGLVYCKNRKEAKILVQNKITLTGLTVEDREQPTVYDVLSCLTKSDPDTFENFCSEYGYDEDSRTAEKIYNAVLDEWKNVCALFTDEEIEQLQEIS